MLWQIGNIISFTLNMCNISFRPNLNYKYVRQCQVSSAKFVHHQLTFGRVERHLSVLRWHNRCVSLFLYIGADFPTKLRSSKPLQSTDISFGSLAGYSSWGTVRRSGCMEIEYYEHQLL
jgi:hypothetical protein